MTTRASLLKTRSRRETSAARYRVALASCLVAGLLASGPTAAKPHTDGQNAAPVVVLSESSQGSDTVAKAVSAALGDPADLRRWTLTFSNRMEPGIRIYANGHDTRPVLDRLGAAGLKAALIETPVGVPYSVLTSSKDRIFLIIGPNP